MIVIWNYGMIQICMYIYMHGMIIINVMIIYIYM